MAEGGFDDMEMEDRNNEFEDYSDEQLRDEHSKLESEYSKIDGDYLNADMSEIVNVKYDKIMDRLKIIKREQERRLEGEKETSFIDDDDGKTITIKNPGSSEVTAPSAEFVLDDDISPQPGEHAATFKMLVTTDTLLELFSKIAILRV